MSHIRYQRVIPWAIGLLTSLESIATVPDCQVSKTSKLSIFWLVFLSSLSVSQDSTITGKGITMIQNMKKLFFSDSQTLHCYYLYTGIRLFIACTPLIGSSNGASPHTTSGCTLYHDSHPICYPIPCSAAITNTKPSWVLCCASEAGPDNMGTRVYLYMGTAPWDLVAWLDLNKLLP